MGGFFKPGYPVPGVGGPGGGATGATGPTGAAGPQGVTGPTGAAGSDGSNGAAGAQGPTGPQGAVGANGSNGSAGAQGSTGPQGAVGADGSNGSNGSAGPQGATGPQGAAGAAGAAGSNGSAGAQGPTGPQGAVGAQGVQGPIGPAKGRISLHPNNGYAPDGSTNNVGARYAVEVGTQTGIHALVPVVKFTGTPAAAPEHYLYSEQVPENYGTTPVVYITGMVNSTSAANIIMQIKVAAVSAGDTDTPLEHAFATADEVPLAVNTTEANRKIEATATLAHPDGMVAGDTLLVDVFRDPDHASDSCSVEFRMTGCEIRFVPA